jgi:hypothetical protein
MFKNLGSRQRTGTGLEAMKIVMAIIHGETVH